MMNSKQQTLAELLSRQAIKEGFHESAIRDLVLFKASDQRARLQTLCEAFIVILGQGNVCCYVGGETYDFSVGSYLTLFLPMSLEIEVLEASLEAPLLAACIRVDLSRIATLLLQMDGVGEMLEKEETAVSSGIFTAPINDKLLDSTVRLLEALDNPRDITILSQAIIDEIYYRVLSDDRAGASSFRHLLEQRGQIQKIARAVNHIQSHLDEKVSVEYLARLVNMSVSSFHRSFKAVMHVSPVKYAQSMKLFRAQTLLKEGYTVSEAGYQVGYNSPAQFSREYKRHFGYTPSATAVST